MIVHPAAPGNPPASHPFSALRLSLIAFLLALSTLLTGCAAGFNANTPVPSAGSALSGRVQGGQQPVTGSAITLYAAGTGGYGTPARSMLAAPGFVTTDSGGNFSITGAYTCQPGDQVYLLARGGNPGLAPGTNNAALVLASALGPCSALLPSTQIIVNELTTVAAAYSLSGFMTSPTNIASSGTALAQIGVKNAFLTASNLATINGFARSVTPAGNGSVPTAELNTLANILAPCVNSSGSILSGSSCALLFSAATPAGGTAPSDSFQAALNIAQNPGNNVAALFALSTASAPFQPTLSTAPNDWTVATLYNRPNINGGNGLGIAVDGLGNIWTLSFTSVNLFDPTGAQLSPASGFTAGLAAGDGTSSMSIDASNNAWIGAFKTSDGSSPRIYKINSAGTLLSPAGGYTGGGLGTHVSYGSAFDSSGNLWSAGTTSFTGSLAASKISSTGAALSPTAGYPLSGFNGVTLSLAGNTSGGMWAGPYLLSSTGTVLTSTSPCGAILSETMALDHSGNLWLPNGGPILECNPAGTQISPGQGYASGFNNTEGASVDGTNRIWYFSQNQPQIGVVSSTGTAISPANGYSLETSINFGSDFMAIDGSGNLWIDVDGPYLAEFVGVASPVVTPLATATATNTLGLRP